VANYVVDRDDPQSAEVAIAVAHDDHQVGVGTALLEHLAQAAIAHGIRHFTAYVLATNDVMLQVLSDTRWPQSGPTTTQGFCTFGSTLPSTADAR
jgi:ribosomal protein S18 acetylase RimI-like enzyme